MFTGLIETTGIIRSVHRGNKSLTIGILPEHDDFSVSIGNSVAVDGACLTAESASGNELTFTAVYETLSHTTLPGRRAGDMVNLERSIRLGDRLEGHIVLGHIDGIGRIRSDRKQGDSLIRTILIPENLRRYMALKGSVAIDGISFTIAESLDDAIAVACIPHTLRETTMSHKHTGDEVNIECDIFARYIAHQLYFNQKHGIPDELSDKENSGILSLLERNGF